MAFSKDKRSERRTWISQREIHPMPNLLTNQFISITDFVDDELVYYFAADCQRSIPSAMDGLKKTSRKVMFALLEKLEDESYPTVDSICGHITKHTAYHHRSSYMAQVIVNMARSFVGSNNNINLIAQGGQCGSREEKRGGNPFYVTTALNPISKLIFPQDDYVLLEHLNEDGMSVEPKTYMPIVPLILINGGFGMASGYKCDVPCYHPIDVIKSIRQLLEKSAPSPMTPYYRGFKGLVRSIALGKHAIEGVFENNGTKILIREIPIGKKFNEYRDFLESLKKKKKIKDYQQKGMEGNICFLVFLYQKKSDNEIKILLGLVIIHTTQLNLLDAEGNLVCYRSVEQFLDHFFEARMELYTRRKKHAINKIRLDIQHIDRELENTNSIRKKYFDLHDQKDILSFQLSTLENEKESEFEIAAWSKELDALEAQIKVLYGESGST